MNAHPHVEQARQVVLEYAQPQLIELRDLCKNYGTKTAVDHVNLSVMGGEVFGFLGPNGAGKTTTIKMIVGLLQPTSGTVKVAGYDMQKQPLQAKVSSGYVPDTPNLYSKLSLVSCCASSATCTPWSLNRSSAGSRNCCACSPWMRSAIA